MLNITDKMEQYNWKSLGSIEFTGSIVNQTQENQEEKLFEHEQNYIKYVKETVEFSHRGPKSLKMMFNLCTAKIREKNKQKKKNIFAAAFIHTPP